MEKGFILSLIFAAIVAVFALKKWGGQGTYRFYIY